MKKLLLTALAGIGFACTLLAQAEQAEVEKLVSKKIDTVLLSEFKVPVHPAPPVIVLDCRADTTKIGYQESRGLRRAGRQNARNFFPYQLEKGTAQGWSHLLANALAGGTAKGEKFVAVLRNFWVSQYESELVARDRPDVIASRRNKIVFTADYFLEHNGLWYPFTRIDTTFIAAAVDRDDESHIITQLLDWHALVFARTDREKARKKTGYTLELIKEKNTLPTHPILAADVTYKKGIYRSFEEFLTNQPGTDFTTVFDKKQKELKVPQAQLNFFRDTLTGERLLTPDIWGYCDGKRIFLKYDNAYFPAARSGNSFEILGAIVAGNRTVDLGPFSGGTIMSSSIHFFLPMQLDMRKGKLY